MACTRPQTPALPVLIPKLVLVPATPPPPPSPSPRRLPSSPVPASFSRRVREHNPRACERTPPPPLPSSEISVPGLEPRATSVAEGPCEPPSIAPPGPAPPSSDAPSPRIRVPALFTLPFTSLVAVDSIARPARSARTGTFVSDNEGAHRPSRPVANPGADKRQTGEKPVCSKHTAAPGVLPPAPTQHKVKAKWRKVKTSSKRAARATAAREGKGRRDKMEEKLEYLLVDAKLEWAMETLGF